MRSLPVEVPAVDRTVRLGSLARQWRESGDGELGTVLMFHSLGLDRRAFDVFRATLPAGWRVISYDQRGHGSIAGATSFDFQDWVRDAIDAVAECSDGPLHLLGHSMGGAVAAQTAARAGGRVASLSLLASPDRGVPGMIQRGAAALLGGMNTVIPPTIARWFGAEGATGDAVSYAKATLRAMQPKGFEAGWRSLASFEGYPTLAVNLPRTLCIAAKDDLSTPPAIMQGIVDAFLAARSASRISMEIMQEGGHMFPLTHSATLAQLLTAHWSAGNLTLNKKNQIF